MTRLLPAHLLGLAVLLGLSGPAAAAPPGATPNAFLAAAAGAPTFVVGTLGTAVEDRTVRDPGDGEVAK